MPTTTAGDGQPLEQARIAALELARATGVDHHDALVVLGTGLGAVAGLLGADPTGVDLSNLPWFPRFSAIGHRPVAWSLPVGDRRCLVMAGRLHLYEGLTPAQVVHPLRTALATGVSTVVLTSAVGAIRPDLDVGDLCVVTDHLSLTGVSPLTGLAAHIDMTDAWSARLRALISDIDPSIAGGVYAQMPGPQFETPAEITMLSRFGADLVGMSMVPELIAARHLGAEVLGITVVTNSAAGHGAGFNAESVVDCAATATPRLAALLAALIPRI